MIRSPLLPHRDEERRGERPRPSAPSPQVARILALQRHAGNQAVGRVLQRLEAEDIAEFSKDEAKRFAALRKRYLEHFGPGQKYANYVHNEEWDYVVGKAPSLAELDKEVERRITDAASKPVVVQQPAPQPIPAAARPPGSEPTSIADYEPEVKEKKHFKKGNKQPRNQVLDLSKVQLPVAWDNPVASIYEPGTPAVEAPAPTVDISAFTSAIDKWSPTVHDGKSGYVLSLAQANALVQWLTDSYKRKHIVYLLKGDGSGDYHGKSQLKVIHSVQKVGDKHATYHITLRPDVYAALGGVTQG